MQCQQCNLEKCYNEMVVIVMVYDFYWFNILFHCFMMCLSCLPALRDKLHTPMARYNLFVLKVSLNDNQLTN